MDELQKTISLITLELENENKKINCLKDMCQLNSNSLIETVSNLNNLMEVIKNLELRVSKLENENL